MGPLDVAWHLLNFFGPAVGVGCISALIAKLVWRSELHNKGVLRLAAWSTGGAALGAVAALVILGRDGRMAGYAILLTSGVLGLWWAAFGSRSA